VAATIATNDNKSFLIFELVLLFQSSIFNLMFCKGKTKKRLNENIDEESLPKGQSFVPSFLVIGCCTRAETRPSLPF
jgi:hypothetical protein